LRLEGVVSKRTDAPYTSGRTSNWTKITCRKRDTLVVAGVAYNGKKFDGIYLARRKDGASPTRARWSVGLARKPWPIL
jgi:bifunctional non-homologous end joining protein LigD